MAENDPWTHLDTHYTYTGTAIKHQTELVNDPNLCSGNPSCYYPYYPGYYSYRGNEMWWGGGLIYEIKPYPADAVCQD